MRFVESLSMIKMITKQTPAQKKNSTYKLPAI